MESDVLRRYCQIPTMLNISLAEVNFKIAIALLWRV
jgi:hypothetical protein